MSYLQKNKLYKILINNDVSPGYHHYHFERFCSSLEKDMDFKVRLIPENKKEGYIFILDMNVNLGLGVYKFICIGGVGYDYFDQELYSISIVK